MNLICPSKTLNRVKLRRKLYKYTVVFSEVLERVGIAMSLKEQDLFLQAMEFIIDAVALSTDGESRAEVGLYLMSLLVAEHKSGLSPEKLNSLKLLIEKADALESTLFKL